MVVSAPSAGGATQLHPVSVPKTTTDDHWAKLCADHRTDFIKERSVCLCAVADVNNLKVSPLDVHALSQVDSGAFGRACCS